MVLVPTKEMNELRKIFAPYFEKGSFELSETAPKEAKEARAKYLKLFDEQWELAESLM
jgi:hypothetical protein